MTTRRRRAAAGHDRGSLSIEYVLVVPMVLLVFALIYVFGEVSQMNSALDAATRDAARVATQADSWQQARDAAYQVVRDAVRSQSAECSNTLQVDVSQPFAPDTTITVTASCTYPLTDGLPGVPGSLHVASRFSSYLGPNQGVQQ